MKVLSTNLNQNSPIYSQNKNCKQSNVNFEANLVFSLDEKIFKKLDPTSAPLRKKFLDTRLGRICRNPLTSFFKDTVFSKMGVAKKEIFIDIDEQKKLSELITAASEELGIPTQTHAPISKISDDAFNVKWNAQRTASAILRKYVEGLIAGAEDVESDVIKEHWAKYEQMLASVQESFRKAIAKKPESKK